MLDLKTPQPAGGAKFLTGLVGRDIAASRSPWLHECEADALGVRLVYSLFDFAARGWADSNLPRLLDSAQFAGFAGLNITHPFKQTVITYLDSLSETAQRVGAVNAVKFVDGKRIGHNTDVTGFAENMRVGLPQADLSRVVQIGAGGAGAATAHALLGLGVGHLEIYDKAESKLDQLVDALRTHYDSSRISKGSGMERSLANASGVVNATPIGMINYPGSAVPVDRLEARHWVADIVYFPLETELLREAKLRGCRTLDGGGMAVYQAADAFEIFTGLTVNRARMLESFSAFVNPTMTRAA